MSPCRRMIQGQMRRTGQRLPLELAHEPNRLVDTQRQRNARPRNSTAFFGRLPFQIPSTSNEMRDPKDSRVSSVTTPLKMSAPSIDFALSTSFGNGTVMH